MSWAPSKRKHKRARSESSLPSENKYDKVQQGPVAADVPTSIVHTLLQLGNILDPFVHILDMTQCGGNTHVNFSIDFDEVHVLSHLYDSSVMVYSVTHKSLFDTYPTTISTPSHVYILNASAFHDELAEMSKDHADHVTLSECKDHSGLQVVGFNADGQKMGQATILELDFEPHIMLNLTAEYATEIEPDIRELKMCLDRLQSAQQMTIQYIHGQLQFSGEVKNLEKTRYLNLHTMRHVMDNDPVLCRYKQTFNNKYLEPIRKGLKLNGVIRIAFSRNGGPIRFTFPFHDKSYVMAYVVSIAEDTTA